MLWGFVQTLSSMSHKGLPVSITPLNRRFSVAPMLDNHA